MAKFIRLIALILALVMLLPCVIACDDNDDEKNNDNDNADTSDVVKTKLPDKDWQGAEFHVLGADGSSTGSFEICVDQYPEDVVGQAVYNRNESLKQKYNFTVTKEVDHWTNEVAQVAYESSDDLYDLVIYRPYRIQPHAQSGYLLNLLDSETLPYLDLEHESWDQYINEQLTVAGKLFYTSNDFLLVDKHRTQLLFYNREMARNLNLGLYPDSNIPFEQMVYNNEWTLENVAQIVKSVYSDNDGNPGATEMDQYGLGMENHGNYLALVMGAGFKFSRIDSKGELKLVGATDKMLNILDKVLEFTADRTATFVLESELPGKGAGDHLFPHFSEGRILMVTEFPSFYDAWLYQVEFEVGALPNPKYDSTQERYQSCPNTTNGSLFAIPYTVADPDRVSFCLEALTEASTNTTYKAYIDTKCKYQEAYDEDCANMLELAFSGTVYDIAGICDFGGLYVYIRSDVQKNRKNAYTRMYQMNAKSANTAITKLIEDYNKLD